MMHNGEQLVYAGNGVALSSASHEEHAMELARGKTIKFRGSLLSLLAAVAFAALPGLAQYREWRPIDPSAA